MGCLQVVLLLSYMTEIDIIISDLIEVFVEYIDYKVFYGRT